MTNVYQVDEHVLVDIAKMHALSEVTCVAFDIAKMHALSGVT